MTVVISVVAAVPLAVLSALYRDRWPDTLVRAGTTLGFGMPQFWVGLLLILLVSVELRLPVFPVAGYGDTFGRARVAPGACRVVTLSLGLIVVLMRPLRAEILELLQSDFVEMARAKGVKMPRLMWRHVLRNALVAVVTILGVRVGWLISGTVVDRSGVLHPRPRMAAGAFCDGEGLPGDPGSDRGVRGRSRAHQSADGRGSTPSSIRESGSERAMDAWPDPQSVVSDAIAGSPRHPAESSSRAGTRLGRLGMRKKLVIGVAMLALHGSGGACSPACCRTIPTT